MGPVNRQDVQNIINNAQNRIFDRVASRQDMLVLIDAVRTLSNLHQQSQQLLKQSEYQRSQLARRTVALETRMSNIEVELKNTQMLVGRVLDRIGAQQLQKISLPAQPEQQRAAEPATQYVYRPS